MTRLKLCGLLVVVAIGGFAIRCGPEAVVHAQQYTINVTTLNGDIDARTQTLEIASATPSTGSSFGPPSAGQCLLLEGEFMSILARDGTTLTVRRSPSAGLGSATSAVAHPSGSVIWTAACSAFKKSKPLTLSNGLGAGQCRNQPGPWIDITTANVWWCNTATNAWYGTSYVTFIYGTVPVTNLNPPTLTDVSPNQGAQGTSASVTLTGTDFVPGGTTVAVGGTGVTVTNVVVVSTTSITATFTFDAGATLGVRNVAITTLAGTNNCCAQFTIVNPPPPTLTSVTPNTGVQGGTVAVTLVGTNFVPGATTVAVSGSGVSNNSVLVTNSTHLTANFVISGGAAATARNVSVTTASGTSGNQTFTVTAAGGGAPTLTSVTPSSGDQGTTAALTLVGTNFDTMMGATSVAVSGSGITVNTLVVGSTTSLTVHFVIAGGAAATARNVTVTTGSGTSNSQTFTVTIPSGPGSLVHSSDLTWIGSFRVPNFSNGGNFEFGGIPMQLSAAGANMYMGTYNHTVAEIVIPALVMSLNIADLNFATYAQGFVDITEGHIGDSNAGGAQPTMGGTFTYGGSLYGAVYNYYDGNSDQTVSHFKHSLTLSTMDFSGFSTLASAPNPGFVDAYMANIPAAWQTALGGPAATGNCCVPIIQRTSSGPSLFSWDPAVLNPGGTTTSVHPLVYYPLDHALEDWQTQNNLFNGTTRIRGIAFPTNSRSVLFIGRHGTGPWCYGDVPADCTDPSDPSHGTHAYPYRQQIWAYDLNDLAAVKAGTMNPWDVMPYDYWGIVLPVIQPATFYNCGADYDPATKRLYICEQYADQDGFAYRPLIHVYSVGF